MPAFALPILGVLRGIPRWVWLLLAVALAFRFAVNWHAGKIEALEKAAYGRGVTDTVAAAAQLQAERARLDAAIAAELRNRHDEENRRIAAAADRLRLRGPGKAACPDPSGLPAGTGRHGAAGRSADAAVDRVPDTARPELIAMPFAGTVAFGGQHDGFRTEALSWREWHRRFTAERERLSASADSNADLAADKH